MCILRNSINNSKLRLNWFYALVYPMEIYIDLHHVHIMLSWIHDKTVQNVTQYFTESWHTYYSVCWCIHDIESASLRLSPAKSVQPSAKLLNDHLFLCQKVKNNRQIFWRNIWLGIRKHMIGVTVCLCWRCTRAGTTSDPDVVLLRWAF